MVIDKVFSSTFTDTTVERNALMEEIYPKLKEYCRETYGLDFQVFFLDFYESFSDGLKPGNFVYLKPDSCKE